MQVHLIHAAYDSGRFQARMGQGPDCFLRNGAAERLRALGHAVTAIEVDPKPDYSAEVATSFAVMRGVAEEVGHALAAEAFPLVLAGNCNSSVGIVSGLAPRRIGVVWFDAHGDFNTPETTSSGFLDGMGLAILTGRCWQALAGSIPGYAPVSEENVILAGARDFDELEWGELSKSEIAYLSDRDLQSGDLLSLGTALERLVARVEAVYLHIDLDVHDVHIAPANHFRPPGGLTPERLQEVIAFVRARVPVAAAYVGSYDPDVDPKGVTLDSGLALIETIVSDGLRTTA